jgi:hypothetical protein
MIQVYVLTAPLGQLDPGATVDRLEAASKMVTRLHPALRGYTVEATNGTLRMNLRVAGRDRWAVSSAVRKIASNMLLRARIPVPGATLELERTMPTAKDLTKMQGRSVTAKVASGDR